jgi:DNA-binding XRE family transcriptional regulator
MDVKTIRALRQEHGWTQFELAIKVGVQPQAVYFWESGRRTPQVPQLRKLGQIFKMCSDDIDLTPYQPSTQRSDGSRDEQYEPVDADLDGRGRETANNQSPKSLANE